MTILPGAVNTFALIISSYTIVLALKTAKQKDWQAPSGLMGKLMPDQKSAVRNYLIATFLLGSMFIVLKLVEWSHLGRRLLHRRADGSGRLYRSGGVHLLHLNRRSRRSRVRGPAGDAVTDLQSRHRWLRRTKCTGHRILWPVLALC